MNTALWTSRLATLLRGNPARAAARRTPSDPPPNHELILYDYEASPWCRLVREYATILDLSLHIRPCPRQTLLREGAFTKESRYRPEAMEWIRKALHTKELMFPVLVDKTKMMTECNDGAKSKGLTWEEPIVIQQSYTILEHLWEHYGQTVVASSTNFNPEQENRRLDPQKGNRRPDQIINASRLPFALRFLSLAAPSYLRPWPHCGLLRIPSRWTRSHTATLNVTLFQSEGCPESRLVRELLCSLEIPYHSVPVAT